MRFIFLEVTPPKLSSRERPISDFRPFVCEHPSSNPLADGSCSIGRALTAVLDSLCSVG